MILMTLRKSLCQRSRSTLWTRLSIAPEPLKGFQQKTPIQILPTVKLITFSRSWVQRSRSQRRHTNGRFAVDFYVVILMSCSKRLSKISRFYFVSSITTSTQLLTLECAPGESALQNCLHCIVLYWRRWHHVVLYHIHRVPKKLSRFVFVRTSPNFHQFR